MPTRRYHRQDDVRGPSAIVKHSVIDGEAQAEPQLGYLDFMCLLGHTVIVRYSSSRWIVARQSLERL